MALDVSAASAYSEEQIAHYLNYICLPQKYHPKSNPCRNLEMLTALYTYQLSAIPFENLSLHYSLDHKVDLDPQVLYRKFITDGRGRGGYCMETCVFFSHVLRGLGFQVFTAGARVKPRVNGVPQGDYMGWVHVVNIVTLADGVKYMVDVGFGGDGAIKPIPLVDGEITQNLGTQQLRLVYDSIPPQLDKSRKLWIYQYRNSESLEWNSFYSFPELEFLQQDMEVMSYFTSSSPGSFHTYTILVVKYLRKGGEIYGKVMMVADEVKQNLSGKTTLVKTCKTEAERVETLKEYFGFSLTGEEIEGIRGRSCALPYQ